jgi:hypothetical protein
MQLNKDRQRKEYVVLSEILADEVNAYAREFKSQPVESINGRNVWSLRDVQDAFSEEAEFYTVKFMGETRVLSMEGARARQRQEIILQTYGVPAAARTEEGQ